MENTETTLDKQFFIDGYKDYCNRVGSAPGSAYRLCRFLFVSEEQFYIQFESLKTLKQEIFSNLLNPTFEKLSESKEYTDYSARERLLAFYYTLIEDLNPQHAFIHAAFSKFRWNLFVNHQLDALKEAYLPYVNDLIKFAQETQEVTSRVVVENYYQQAFYLHLVFVLNYFSQDTSENYSNTDAAIEKSTHLLFDLLQKNAADATIDFGKFLFQQKF